MTSDLSGTESQIADRTIPESQTWNRQNSRDKRHKSESNCSKVEAQKIDSEFAASQCLKLLRREPGIA